MFSVVTVFFKFISQFEKEWFTIKIWLPQWRRKKSCTEDTNPMKKANIGTSLSLFLRMISFLLKSDFWKYYTYYIYNSCSENAWTKK